MLALLLIGCVDAFLHYAAPVHVTGNLGTVLHHCVINELLLRVLPRGQNLLDHMVAVNLKRKSHKDST